LQKGEKKTINYADKAMKKLEEEASKLIGKYDQTNQNRK